MTSEANRCAVDVLMPIGGDRAYSYLAGPDVVPGTLVRAPFGNRMAHGVVVSVSDGDKKGMANRLKQVEPLAADLPPLPGDLITMLSRLAAYGLVSPATMYRTALPKGVFQVTGFRYRAASGRIPLFLSREELALVSFLGEGGRTAVAVRRRLGAKAEQALLRLMAMGVVTRELTVPDPPSERVKQRAVTLSHPPDADSLAQLAKRAPKQAKVLQYLLSRPSEAFHLCAELAARFSCGYDVFHGLEKKGYVRIFQDFKALVRGDRHFLDRVQLTEAQQSVVDDFRRDPTGTRLLLGVTGSGKTECYLRCAEHVMAAGRRVLYLVPEIGLTPMTISRLKVRFGADIAILHSGLSAGARLSEWFRVLTGRVRIVVGTRSAVFAPIHDLGLVVVDEENDASYKQSAHPRYNAVHAALLRAQAADVPVLLGSATPTLESYAHGLSGRYKLHELPDRVAGGAFPTVTLVDMKQVFERHKGKRMILSDEMQTAIRETLSQGRQVLLFLNRRGFAPFLLCRRCGRVEQCPRCSVSMTVHAGRGGDPLRCHYCGHSAPLPHVCPDCGDSFIQMMGFGTQRVEQRLKRLFPEARIFRADRDTMSRRRAFDGLTEQMLKGEIDILLGTQMVARGHHFPGVQMVGILDADTGLKFPDFRSAEKTFSLLLQVAGRAGREDGDGRVLVQTYLPEHPVFAYLARGDFRGFAERELAFRRRAGYPPAGYLVALEVRGRDEGVVAAASLSVAEAVRGAASEDVQVLGPSPAGIYRLKGWFRQQVLVRGSRRPAVRSAAAAWQRIPIPDGVRLTPDVDPLQIG